MLVKFAAKKKSQWDEFLDTCGLAYNTSWHESTCFIPFELMFGRKATLTIDIEMCKDAADDCLKRVLNVGELLPFEVEHCKMGSKMFAVAKHVLSTSNWLSLPKFCTMGKVTGWQSASVSSCVKRQITALLATKHSIITLKHMDIQMQSGTYNCGPSAIAFATALVQGEHPGKLLCNQDSMKQHLIKCLELGEITMFPVKQTRWNAGRVKSEDIIEVHCSCRMPKVPRVDMIECSSCNKWFHFPLCVSVPQKATARVCGIAILVCTYKVCTSF